MKVEAAPHFLVATFPLQGHINPGRQLARKLTQLIGARVTFSTSISGHQRMFGSRLKTPDQEVEDGLITYMPFSDGYDDGFPETASLAEAVGFYRNYKAAGSSNMAALLQTLAARGRPVTCVIYTILLPWAARVAEEAGIPSVHYWIQPATVFATYYHFFHGYETLITSHANEPSHPVHLPGLPPMQIRDLPSFLTITDPSDPYAMELVHFRELFHVLDMEAARGSTFNVLLNTLDALEAQAIAAVDGLHAVAIGPLLPTLLEKKKKKKVDSNPDLFKSDEKKKYVDWLDSKPQGSVVYISFGSLTMLSKEQLHQISSGITASKRPYLWVVRRDNRGDADLQLLQELELEQEVGMVVEWCSQLEVLAHPSVGCFVTHCGWNSTLESLMCGVPMVCVPQMSDQDTIAKLVHSSWGAGIRAETRDDGLLEATELRRCVDYVVDQEKEEPPALALAGGGSIKGRAAQWRACILQAISQGGSSDSNFKTFIHHLPSPCTIE